MNGRSSTQDWRGGGGGVGLEARKEKNGWGAVCTQEGLINLVC